MIDPNRRFDYEERGYFRAFKEDYLDSFAKYARWIPGGLLISYGLVTLQVEHIIIGLAFCGLVREFDKMNKKLDNGNWY